MQALAVRPDREDLAQPFASAPTKANRLPSGDQLSPVAAGTGTRNDVAPMMDTEVLPFASAARYASRPSFDQASARTSSVFTVAYVREVEVAGSTTAITDGR